MLKLRQAAVAILACTCICEATMAVVIPARCLEEEKLDSLQAAGRREWAMKCFPAYRSFIMINADYLEASTGKITPAYPIFRFFDDDANASNPLNWFAPTQGGSSCAHPSGYDLAGFCPSGDKEKREPPRTKGLGRGGLRKRVKTYD